MGFSPSQFVVLRQEKPQISPMTQIYFATVQMGFSPSLSS